MKITSTSNPLIQDLVKLKKNSFRKEKQMFLCEGEDFIKEAISSTLAKHIFYTRELNYDIPFTLVSENVLKKLSVYENSNQPVILCSYPKLNKELGNKLVYLDYVQDPGNVGTILRTALAFSYSGVVLSSTTASIYSQKVISSSKGAIFHLPTYENITLEDLKNMGYQIIVTALKDSIDYKDIKLSDKFVLVFGNEGQGVSENSLELASQIVKIDISDKVESLNVAIASGILMERYR